MTDRSSSVPSSDVGSGTSGSPSGEPPGSLGEQLGRTRKALLGLIASHVDLAKAEFSEIAGELKKAAALAGVALFLLFLTAILIFVGTLLFAGEALFGSMGWGVLLGSELMLALAVVLALSIVDMSGRHIAGAFAVALGVGLVIGGLVAADWPSLSKNNSGLLAQPWMAVISGAILLGIVFALLASSFGRSAASGAAIGGIILGALFGLLASAGPGGRVAAGLGLAVGILVWPITQAVLVFRNGFDTKLLRDRFVPDVTIETTKETIEWVRAQMPLGPKS